MTTPARRRYRHDPQEPRTLVATMVERTSAAGRRYFYAFDTKSGEKFFMVPDDQQPGQWRLYAQPLTSPNVVADHVERAPQIGSIVRSLPADRREFASGLPDRSRWPGQQQ